MHMDVNRMPLKTKTKLSLVQEHHIVQLEYRFYTHHTNAFKGIYGSAKI
jgi:hypothetical protein